MGWKGMKSALPTKGMRLFSSKRKTSRPNVVVEARNQSGFFFEKAHRNPQVVESPLNQSFDKLRVKAEDEKDALGVESTMAYLESLGVNIENAEMLIVAELLQTPSIGTITRKGYVDGWKALGLITPQDHSAHVKSLVSKLATDSALFRKVYRHTFAASKEDNQKAIPVETAVVYWDVLFSPPAWEWKTKSHDWLALWKEFLEQKWTRSVNRDMWNQTLEFAIKTMSDETLSFWNEDGAWPSVIDAFVAWCKERGIGKSEAESMNFD
ncbi:Defective in cullin neddylation protein 1 [Colletotrichum orbiculare MAFF 240422]|uniref:Defective in cullin neddylation protein n=1 Tax=Colletotrichum orbiculare (strain 104-T / ATCC 96160 / CBS 514.97 / LARS 414 / MAFF 240422) TaxID=1213857 RepID=A0A484FMP6_COLOR|nr:Defective in cullin neddylation protein 1 [Colletotrichum orbiculare MAFF 240422]